MEGEAGLLNPSVPIFVASSIQSLTEQAFDTIGRGALSEAEDSKLLEALAMHEKLWNIASGGDPFVNGRIHTCVFWGVGGIASPCFNTASERVHGTRPSNLL